MHTDTGTCVLCEHTPVTISQDDTNRKPFYEYTCPHCGVFNITHSFKDFLPGYIARDPLLVKRLQRYLKEHPVENVIFTQLPDPIDTYVVLDATSAMALPA